MAATTLCEPPPPESGKRGEEIKTWGRALEQRGGRAPQGQPGGRGRARGARGGARLRRDPFSDTAARGNLGARTGIRGGTDARTRGPGGGGDAVLGLCSVRGGNLGPGGLGPGGGRGSEGAPGGARSWVDSVLGSRPVAPALCPAPTRAPDPALHSPAAPARGYAGRPFVCLTEPGAPPRRDVTMPEAPPTRAGRAPPGPRGRGADGVGGCGDRGRGAGARASRGHCSAARSARVRRFLPGGAAPLGPGARVDPSPPVPGRRSCRRGAAPRGAEDGVLSAPRGQRGAWGAPSWVQGGPGWTGDPLVRKVRVEGRHPSWGLRGVGRHPRVPR